MRVDTVETPLPLGLRRQRSAALLQVTTVAVVGLGYVGLPLALLVDKHQRYRVIGIDIDDTKVAGLKRRVSPFEDVEIAKDLKKANLIATTDFSRLGEASIVIICVPTPVTADSRPNLAPLKNACEGVGSFLRKGQLVILESTVNPGITDSVVLPLLEEMSGLTAGKDFFLAHCPERVNPGDSVWKVENINRVIGSLEERGLEKALTFYRSILSAEVTPMGSLEEAEAVKIVENAFRDINIAFVNELAQSFSRLGIDITRVIEGASTKPFAFMPHLPGCGVGGHCIPVDPHYLIEYAKQNGFNHEFLSLARKINSGMPRYAANLVIKGLNENRLAAKGTKVAVLGLAYKAGIDDCRESPSFKIIEHLKEYGTRIATFDPYVMRLSSANSLDEAFEDARAVVIATDHVLFKRIDPAALKAKGIQVVVDGRNCLPKKDFVKAGLTYLGIGR